MNSVGREFEERGEWEMNVPITLMDDISPGTYPPSINFPSLVIEPSYQGTYMYLVTVPHILELADRGAERVESGSVFCRAKAQVRER